jgi:UPF0716 protein FxsA
MVILGGALLLTPGFITDVFGILLLLPPTRALFRRAVTGMARRRYAFTVRTAGWGAERMRRRPYGPPRETGSRPYDYEGSAREVTKPPEDLPRGDEGG